MILAAKPSRENTCMGFGAIQIPAPISVRPLDRSTSSTLSTLLQSDCQCQTADTCSLDKNVIVCFGSLLNLRHAHASIYFVKVLVRNILAELLNS